VTLVAGSMAGFMIGLDATVQGLAWQWVFWLNVPVGVVLVAAGGRVLAESRGPARRLDPAGLALATGAVFAVTDALLRGPAAGWGSAEVLALFAGGAVLAAAFAGGRAPQRGADGAAAAVCQRQPVRGRPGSRCSRRCSAAPSRCRSTCSWRTGSPPLRTGLGVLPFTGPTTGSASAP
jgi:hypothetical protein